MALGDRAGIPAIVVAAFAGAVAGGIPQLAVAQAGAEITEILVTVRKREESLQEVPISVTALTSETIEAAGIRDLYDVAELTPGLSFFNAQGEFLSVPVIRGMAPTDIFGETNAAVFVDGVYVSGREGLNFSQLDLERIEIVKGPQSAMYGRNAFSGAINYVTKMPDDESGARVEATGGSDGRQKGLLMVNMPLIGDTLMARGSALYDEFDGTYDNALPGGDDIGGFRYRSLQGSLLWNATETVQVVGSLYYSNDEIDDSATTGIPASCENRVDTNLDLVRFLNVCGKLPSLDEYSRTLRTIGTPNALSLADALADDRIPKIPRALGEDRDVTRGHLRVDWDAGFGTFTALTGYVDTSQTALIDGSRSLGETFPYVYCTNAVFFADGAYLCGGGTPRALLTTGLLQIEQEDETKEWSQEFRFNSPQDGRLRYYGGAYFYDVEMDDGDGGVVTTNQNPPPFPQQQFGPFVVGPGIIIGDGAFRPWFRPGGDLDPLQRPLIELETTSWSLFTGGDYSVTERLTLDFQVRYGEERKEAAGNLWDETLFDPAGPLLERASAKKTFDAWTGRVGLKFDVSDSWMVYASLANAEKSGGFDVNAITTADDPDTAEIEVPRSGLTVRPFDNEKSVVGEIGIKGTSADGRLSFEMAAYRNNWSDVVVPEVFDHDPVTGEFYSQPESFNSNLGDATVIGWEALMTYQIAEAWTLRLSGAFTDATWDEGSRQGTFEQFPSFRPPECQGTTVTSTPEGRAAEDACQAASGDISGNKVSRQPEWDASASLSYRQPITAGWDMDSRLDASYQGKIFAGNDNQTYLPAHTYVNLALGFESDRYRIEFWGRNLFNDDSPIAAYRDVFFGNTTDYYQTAAPFSPQDAFFPFRYTVTHPRLRTWGVTAKVRFGGEAR